MRVLLIAIFAVLALSVQSAPSDDFDRFFNQFIRHSIGSREDISELLRKAMEKFKQLMIHGDPALGLPPMDPYVMDERNIDLDLEILKGSASVKKLSVSGMSKFIATSVSGNDDPLIAIFDLMVPVASLYADNYKLDAMVAEEYHIFGDGIFDMSADNMRLQGNASGTVDENQHLQVTSLNLRITAEVIKSALTGLMNNDEDCKLANELISEFGPGILDLYGDQLGNFFGEIIRGIINKKIENLTVDQIIDMINKD